MAKKKSKAVRSGTGGKDAAPALPRGVTLLATLTKSFGQDMGGDVAARIDFKLSTGQLVADAAIDSAHLAVAGAELTTMSFTIHLEKGIGEQKQPVFADLVMQTRGSIASLRYADYAADGLALAVASRGSVG